MTIKIGWTWDSSIYPVPESVAFEPEPVKTKKAGVGQEFVYGRCPAVLMYLRRTFTVRSPYDLRIHIESTADGRNKLVVDSPDNDTANRFLVIESPDRWRSPNMPVMQICCPLIFFADQPVLMEAGAPDFHFDRPDIPGVIVPGSFDIHAWQRPVNCAFEWHDLDTPLVIKRGDPLYYVRFHGHDFDERFTLQRVNMHEDLRRAVDYTQGASKFATRTFSLFEKARRLRAKKLIR